VNGPILLLPLLWCRTVTCARGGGCPIATGTLPIRDGRMGTHPIGGNRMGYPLVRITMDRIE